MTAQVFLQWLNTIDGRFAADITRAIGVNRNTAQRWLADAQEGQDIDIRTPMALAMAAVAQGLKPWGKTEGTDHD